LSQDEGAVEAIAQQDTRQELLDAGTQLLAQASRDQLGRVLSAAAVSEAAGRARQTFYRYWETQADYVVDLVNHLTDPLRSHSSQRLEALEDEATGLTPDDPATVVRQVSRQTFERFSGDPGQMARVLLWAVMANDPLIAGHIKDLSRANDEAAARGFMAIGDALGIEPRPPFTYETVALLFNALRTGLLVHVDETDLHVPESFFGDVMVAVSDAVTRRVGDPSDACSIDDTFRGHVRG